MRQIQVAYFLNRPPKILLQEVTDLQAECRILDNKRSRIMLTLVLDEQKADIFDSFVDAAISQYADFATRASPRCAGFALAQSGGQLATP